jgi:ABC-2 type transport system ATP-binding protein
MTSPPVVAIKDLTVTYRRGRVRALDAISTRLPGGLVGLLGPNGAGKTTLLRILAGVLRPTIGTVTVDELDVTTPAQCRAIKAVSGYLPQEFGLYPNLTGRQFLDYMAVLKNIGDQRARRQRITEVLDLVALSDVSNRRLGTYSGGMKRRAGIAQAILNDPRLLIVDEPTAGLDPEERLRFRSLLATLSSDRTVLLSTHIVEDVVQTCPYVVVIKNGTLAFQGPTADLADLVAETVWTTTCPPGTRAPDLPIVTVAPVSDGMRYRVLSPVPPAPDAQAVRPTAEDGYLALMHQDQQTPSNPPFPDSPT